MTTPVDIAALTPTQQDALGCAACGDDGLARFSRRTISALVEKGMLEELQHQDGMVRIYRYAVPMAVHIAWCEWCSQQEDED